MEQGVTYSPNPAPPANSQSRHSVNWVVVGVFGVLLGIMGWLVVHRNRRSELPTPTVSDYVTPSPTYRTPPPVPESIPDWQNFTDPDGIFAIQYPKEYSLQTGHTESTFKGISLIYQAPANTASSSADINIKIIYLANSATSAEGFAKQQVLAEGLLESNIKSSVLNGKSVWEISLSGEWGRGKIIFLEDESTVFRLSAAIMAPLNTIPGFESTVDRIFSTFKILDPDTRGK